MNVFLLTILMTLAYNSNQRSVLAPILAHFSYNLTLSLLVPYSAQSFAFMTTFLAVLVVGILAVQMFAEIKKQSTRLEVQQ
jgi:K+-sensing histidine kinase KdpD